MITEKRGNLLAADVDALVNTVNTVGVMGKGIALQFKRAFPEMFKDYARAAKRDELALGKMHVWATEQLSGPRYVINFPTKGHWRSASRLDDIATGLDALRRTIMELGIRSIALPPLGCGQGGLQWSDVEPLIREKLGGLEGVDVLVFPPAGAPASEEMVSAGPPPAMSPARAAVIRVMSQYAVHAFEWPTLIELQKLVYFLQIAGEPLNLDFEPHFYGPYADPLRKVLREIEGHYIQGFGDGSAPATSAPPLRVVQDAETIAESVISEHDETGQRIERVLALIQGFESPYGLELLATVHWLIDRNPALADDLPELARRVQSWTPRKRRIFGDDHIATAARILVDRGWVRHLAKA